MFGGLIHNALCSGGGSGKDPRIAALERATEFGRFVIPGTAGEDVWELSARHSDELDGYHIYVRNPGDSYIYSHYKEFMLWGCYYKNNEFMFALPSGANWTDIPADYRLNSDDGTVYKYDDRITTITEITGVELMDWRDDSSPYSKYIKITYNSDSVETYYNSDGSVKSQYTNKITRSENTMSIKEADSRYNSHSCLAVIRGSHQTYINDIFDMTKPNFAEN